MKKILATLLIQCLFITSVFAAGKLQDADFKTEAQLITAGATKSSLLNDSKVYTKKGRLNKSGACRVLKCKPKELEDAIKACQELLKRDLSEEQEEEDLL